MSNLKNYLFTSESVSEGHPDKVSDRISDMVVDSFISGDPYSRVACETLTTTNKVVLAGEVRGPEINKDELIQKVRNCIKDLVMTKKDLLGKKPQKLKVIYIPNQLILLWEWTHQEIKMKELEIKVSCLDTLVMKRMF